MLRKCTDIKVWVIWSVWPVHRVLTRLAVLMSISLLLGASADQAAESRLLESNKHSVLSINDSVNLTTGLSWVWGQLKQNWV